MARRCEFTGVSPMTGNNVSHSNRKTKRRFAPNLHDVTLLSDATGQSYKFRITAAALRTVDHRGGLDAFLLKARDEELSKDALRVKKSVKKKLAEGEAASA